MKESDIEILTLANIEKDIKSIIYYYIKIWKIFTIAFILIESFTIFLWYSIPSSAQFGFIFIFIIFTSITVVSLFNLVICYRKYYNENIQFYIVSDQISAEVQQTRSFIDYFIKGDYSYVDFIKFGRKNTSGGSYGIFAKEYYTWSAHGKINERDLVRGLKPFEKVYLIILNKKIVCFYPQKLFKLDDEVKKILND